MLKRGVIAHADANPDYTQRPDPKEPLPKLAAVKSPRAA